jgi:hypothetical protein
MTRRSRLLRTAVLVAVTILLALGVPARWSVRVAVLFALSVIGLAWVLSTLAGLALDFYWPPKGGHR